MAHSKTWRFLAAGLALYAVIAISRAQSYSIDWFTIDGGGGTSTGGVYTLSATIGQPDAGAMLGGQFILQGGFWGIVAVVQTPGAPYLTITQTNHQIIISWTWPAPGWVLAETNRLEGLSHFSNWRIIPVNQYQTNGARILHVVSATSGIDFFRLEAVAGPVVLGVTPGNGFLQGGNMVTVLGEHFEFGSRVLFGAAESSSVSVISSSLLSCVVAAGAQAGACGVTIINPDGQSFTMPDAYTYQSGVSPNP